MIKNRVGAQGTGTECAEHQRCPGHMRHRRSQERHTALEGTADAAQQAVARLKGKDGTG